MYHRGRRVAMLAVAGFTVGILLSTLAVTAGSSAGLGQAELVTSNSPRAAGSGVDTASTQPELVVTEEYRLTPDQPGKIDVQWHFEMPDNVEEVETGLPEEATNVRTDGFDTVTDSDGFETSDSVYEWSESGTSGSITFTLPANVTADARTAHRPGGRYQFVDTGEWAIVPRQSSPPVWYSYRAQTADEEPTLVYRNRTAGPGVVGDGIVYLGEYDSHQWDAHDQSFRLVVPQSATLTDSPGGIADSLSSASDRLRVGERDEEVVVVAAPTTVSWQVLGLQRGDSDFYVLANQSVDDPNNVWLHEYVHTRQDGNWTAETRWFSEASAEYYAALLTLQQDRIDYETFRDQLDRGTWRRFEDVRLAVPETWLGNNGDYYKGALVTGSLDRNIRVATDGGATLQTVFRRINGHESTLSQSAFLGYVEDAGGAGVADSTREFTETTATPRTWSPSEHEDAFGPLPAVFQYDLPAVGTENIRVRGPYRNGSLDQAVLLDGETLILDIGVRNVGDETGSYNLSVTVDGNVATLRSGSLAADETATETVALSLNGTGSYDVGVRDEQMTIQVRDPPSPQVVSMETNRSRPSLGDPVRISATVENPEQLPAVGSIHIRRNGTTIAVRDVQLNPGEQTTVGATTVFANPGRYRLSVGTLNLTVTATDMSSTETPGSGSGDGSSPTDESTTPGANGSGFGVGVALLALLVAFVSSRIRHP